MKKLALRIVIGLVAALALALGVGAVYEWQARRQAERDFPPSGVLVDVGGRRIHIDCRGQGQPTVVFESGFGVDGALAWSAVHPQVATKTRACAYSRAGMMWSDPGPGPRDADAVATDLARTLLAAGERPPYVMVAHSMGGPFATNFTRLHGRDVAGLVLVDASHPEQSERLREFREEHEPDWFERVGVALAWAGVVRLLDVPLTPRKNEDPASARAIDAFAPRSTPAAAAEAESIARSLSQAGAYRSLGDRPLVVLTAAAPYKPQTLAALGLSPEQGRRMKDAWKAMQAEQAAWSTRGRHQLVEDATHYIQFDRPDAVIAAIDAVVADVRGERR